jgi:hypothetical protein
VPGQQHRQEGGGVEHQGRHRVEEVGVEHQERFPIEKGGFPILERSMGRSHNTFLA